MTEPESRCANCRTTIEAGEPRATRHASAGARHQRDFQGQEQSVVLCVNCLPARERAKLAAPKGQTCVGCGEDVRNRGRQRWGTTAYICNRCAPEGGARKYLARKFAELAERGLVDEHNRITPKGLELAAAMRDPVKLAAMVASPAPAEASPDSPPPSPAPPPESPARTDASHPAAADETTSDPAEPGPPSQ